MPDNPNILVAPLDWGLGHATRCIPIIRALARQGSNPVIASAGRALELLRAEFSHLNCLVLPSYRVRYPTKNMVWNMAIRSPGFARAIALEHARLQHLIRRYRISGVISDQRYGCFSREVPSVFITHQLHPQVPGRLLSAIATRLHHHLIRRFDACWIPDARLAPGLAGVLSHPPLRMPTEYIGMLSRLLPVRPEPVRYDQLFLLSGPEPQRSRLERRLLDEAQRLGKPTLLVRGVTEGGFTRRKSANLEVVSYLTTDGLNKAIAQSRLVVCRPGYSTLMDLARLGKRAVLIPTPGQTEQEYLAAQLFHQGKYFCQQQDRVDLREAWSRVDQFEGFSGTSFDGTALDRAIARFLKGEWN